MVMRFPVRRPRLVSGPDCEFPGSDYSDEEREFLMAMESYKRRNHRPFPTWREVLYVANNLGYRRVADPVVKSRTERQLRWAF
jgi:hypothetical protein